MLLQVNWAEQRGDLSWRQRALICGSEVSSRYLETRDFWGWGISELVNGFVLCFMFAPVVLKQVFREVSSECKSPRVIYSFSHPSGLQEEKLHASKPESVTAAVLTAH